jgi:hypothetical protein
MRANEFLSESILNEEQVLNASELWKPNNRNKNAPTDARVQLFLTKVKNQIPFPTINNDPFIVDPKTYNQLAKQLKDGFKTQSKGQILVKSIGGEVISTGKLLKTSDFSSYSSEPLMPSLPSQQELDLDNANASPEEKSKKQELAAQREQERIAKLPKSAFKLNPSEIFAPNQAYTESELYSTALHSSVLLADPAGPAAIKMAQDIIVNGKNPTFPPKTPPYMEAALHDVAGEWLGIMAVLKGVADFPNI